MKRVLQSFDLMPRFFQILFAVFLMAPVWSTVTMGSPLALAETGGALAWTALAAYWIAPLALCLALFLRSYAVVFLFMAECGALVVHTALNAAAGGTTPALALSRAGLIACVAVLGFAFLSRDIAMPFFAAKKRGFRGAARLRVNSSLRVTGAARKDVTAEMEDVSLLGMSLAIGAGDGTAPFARGDEVQVAVRMGKEAITVAATVQWCVRDELFFRVGVRTSDVAAMSQVIKGVTLRAVPAYRAAMLRLMTRTSLSRAALGIWLTCFGGVAAVPACGTADFAGGGSKIKQADLAKTKHVQITTPSDKSNSTLTAGKKDPLSDAVSDGIMTEDIVQTRPNIAVTAAEAKDARPASCEITTTDGPDFKPGDPAHITFTAHGLVKAAVLEGVDVNPAAVAKGMTSEIVVTESKVIGGSVTGLGSQSCFLELAVNGIKPPKPPQCTLTASANHIQKNESATLTLACQGAASATIDGLPDAHFPNGTGEYSIPSIGNSSEFVATVIGTSGLTSIITATILVDDEPPPPAKPSCSITATPQTIAKGGSARLVMTTTGDVTNATLNDAPVTVAGGRVSVSPTDLTTFNGSVTGPGGNADCKVDVKVDPAPAADCALTATPGSATVGTPITVAVVAHNSVRTVLAGNAIADPNNGSAQRTPAAAGTTTYVATAYNSANVPASCAVSVAVAPGEAPPVRAIQSIALTPTAADVHADGTLQFTATATYNLAPLTEDVTATGTWSVPAGPGFVQALGAGKYKAVAPGLSTVQIALDGKTARASLNVFKFTTRTQDMVPNATTAQSVKAFCLAGEIAISAGGRCANTDRAGTFIGIENGLHYALAFCGTTGSTHVFTQVVCLADTPANQAKYTTRIQAMQPNAAAPQVAQAKCLAGEIALSAGGRCANQDRAGTFIGVGADGLHFGQAFCGTTGNSNVYAQVVCLNDSAEFKAKFTTRTADMASNATAPQVVQAKCQAGEIALSAGGRCANTDRAGTFIGVGADGLHFAQAFCGTTGSTHVFTQGVCFKP